MNFHILKEKKGFSLIEIIVVISIFVLIIFLSYAGFNSLNKTQIVEKDTEAVVAILEEAKSKTRSSVDSSNYGVYFENGGNRAISFKGTSYNEFDPDNEEFTLSSNISISAVDIEGGGDSVVFERPKGNTVTYGNIAIIMNDNSASSTITVYPTGAIEVL